MVPHSIGGCEVVLTPLKRAQVPDDLHDVFRVQTTPINIVQVRLLQDSERILRPHVEGKTPGDECYGTLDRKTW